MPGVIPITLAAGAISGLLYASAVGGTLGAIMLALLAMLPLFLAGLALGNKAAGIAAIAGLVPVALIAGLAPAANYAVATAVPAAMVVRFALLSRQAADGTAEWYPPGTLVTWLSLYAAGIFLAAVVFFLGVEGGLEGLLRALLGAVAEQMSTGAPAGGNLAAVLDALAPMMPGMAAATWLLVVAGNAALAQALLVRFGRNMRPSPNIATIAVPTWLVTGVAVGAAVGFLAPGQFGFVGRNLAMILAVPYFFVGLAVFHAWVQRTGVGNFAYFVFYAGLALFLMTLSLLAVMAVAAVGLFDQFVDLRGQKSGPGKE